MELLTIFLFLALLINSVITQNLQNPKWLEYKEKYNLSYNEESEETKRFLIFHFNYMRIRRHNIKYEIGNETYSQGLYNLHCLTQSEIRKNRKGVTVPKRVQVKLIKKKLKKKASVATSLGSYPLAVDSSSSMPPAGDQGYCGSCWAFSSAHVIERCLYAKNGNVTDISKQQILDCSTVDYGCYGGWPADTLRAFKSSNFQFVQGKDYPYVAVQGTCQTMTNKATFRIGNTYPSSEFLNSESDLIGLVATYGSVAVAVNANLNFQSYSSGIFDDPTCNSGGCGNVDHAVTIIGYNMSAPIPYWIVMNSWGTSWGQSGRILMAMNKNTCNIGCYGISVSC